jgi:hypothetical protein
MEPTQFDFIFGFYAKLSIKYIYRAFLLIYHRFLSVALFLPEFRIVGVRSKIRTSKSLHTN